MFEFKSNDKQLFTLIELFKIQHDEQTRNGRKVEYIGVRQRSHKAFVFWWQEVDTIKFYACRFSDKWHCYNFETGEELKGTEEMFNYYMATTTTTDDYTRLIEQSERVL